MPYAGGGSHAYDAWSELLPPTIEAQTLRLPGRETRFSEEPPCDLYELAAALAAELAPYLTSSTAILGHSMGALLAFEVVRALRRSHDWEPACLLVSGVRAPQLSAGAPRYAGLSGPDLEEEVRGMFGGAAPILDERDLWELMLPVFRADLLMCDLYEYCPEPPLSCPVVAYGSTADKDVDEELVAAWSKQTTGPFERRMFPGEHFYLLRWPEAFAMDVTARLARYAVPRRS
ncbi:thioesterase II family protein [Streptomyces hygroscopicus]|uniref:thioesterase II family protein n=1 Tax=Streptomyces hygroscopicus TaxID=1912 RepID=UPI00369D3621